ncbi:MAG: hypothetical protein Q8P18_03315 [Pseudomonadota bacterium]|nr:hypothetical protein [Pseudomonadota bacterium]
MLLLSFVSSALALTIPVRATHTEWIFPGEAPTAGAATTAAIKVSNPTTGAGFTTSGELTATKREASGEGELTFAGDPADTVRSWAWRRRATPTALAVLGDTLVVGGAGRAATVALLEAP